MKHLSLVHVFDGHGLFALTMLFWSFLPLSSLTKILKSFGRTIFFTLDLITDNSSEFGVFGIVTVAAYPNLLNHAVLLPWYVCFLK